MSKRTDLFDRADRAIAQATAIHDQVRDDIENAYAVAGRVSRRRGAPEDPRLKRRSAALSHDWKVFTREDLDRANAMALEANRRLMSHKGSDRERAEDRAGAFRSHMLQLQLEARFVILTARRDRIALSFFERYAAGRATSGEAPPPDET